MKNQNLIIGLGLGAVIAYLLINRNKQTDVIAISEPEPQFDSWWGRNIVYPFFYGYPSIIQVTSPAPPPPPISPPPPPPPPTTRISQVVE